MRAVISLGIRVSTLLLKLFFVVYAVKLLPESDYAHYSLITAAISYSMYIIGLDYYTYSNRKYLGSNTLLKKNVFVTNHLIFSILSCLVFIPLIAIFFSKTIDISVVYFFVFLVVFEYLSVELYRYLIIQDKQVVAIFTIFIRQGLWILLFIFLSFLGLIKPSLEALLILWGGSSFLSVVISLYFVIHNTGLRFLWNKISFYRIYIGIISSVPMLCSALASRGVFFFDKYFISKYLTSEQLALYSFFFSISFTLITLFESFIVAFFMPKLVTAGQQKDRFKLKKLSKEFLWKSLTFSGIFVFISLGSFNFLLDLVGKSHWISYFVTFIFLLLSAFLQCVSFVPYYILYSLNKDKYILLSQVVLFFSFCAFLVFLMPSDVKFVSVFLLSSYVLYFIVIASFMRIAWIENFKK